MGTIEIHHPTPFRKRQPSLDNYVEATVLCKSLHGPTPRCISAGSEQILADDLEAPQTRLYLNVAVAQVQDLAALRLNMRKLRAGHCLSVGLTPWCNPGRTHERLGCLVDVLSLFQTALTLSAELPVRLLRESEVNGSA